MYFVEEQAVAAGQQFFKLFLTFDACYMSGLFAEGRLEARAAVCANRLDVHLFA